MAGFQVDMSPLERSSRFIGQSLANTGQSISNTIGMSQQQGAQEQSQAEIENLLNQAMSGDPAALQELMVKSPPAAKMVAQQLQSQQSAQQGEDDAFKGQMAEDTAGFIEQMHLAPAEQQEAMFNAAINDPRYDIDEEDRNSFMDVGARKAIIGRVKGKEYADNFFGSEDKAKFTQGTGIASGMAFNQSTGEFTVNQNLKDKLDLAKTTGELDVKTRQSINKDFTSLTADTKVIRNTAKDLENLSKSSSGPASIAMVFKFMKALDPTSVVREGEFATAENSAGVPEGVRNIFNKILTGERLGDKQVVEFVNAAKALANSAIESSEVEIVSYLDTFENTLTPAFKKSIRERIPKRFDVGADSGVNWEDL